MRKKPPREDYVILLPTDPAGADDPTIIEAFPEHFRLIGWIVAEWSHVEHKLIILFAVTAGMKSATASAMLYAIESSAARLAAMEVLLVSAAPDDGREEIASILSDAAGLLAQRNKYAHALYGETATGQLAILGMRRTTENDLPLHDLDCQFKRMKALSFRVGRLLSRRVGLYQEQP